MTHDRIAPQPPVLQVRPIDLRELDREALARANGLDPSKDRVVEWAGLAAVMLLLAAVVRCLC